MDKLECLLPHMDARVLIYINPSLDLHNYITFDLDDQMVTFPTMFLGSINTCFLCRRDGHMRHAFFLIKTKKKPNPNSIIKYTVVHCAL